jgi:hypothetical protein
LERATAADVRGSADLMVSVKEAEEMEKETFVRRNPREKQKAATPRDVREAREMRSGGRRGGGMGVPAMMRFSRHVEHENWASERVRGEIWDEEEEERREEEMVTQTVPKRYQARHKKEVGTASSLRSK